MFDVKIINNNIEDNLSNKNCIYVKLDYDNPIINGKNIAYPILSAWLEKTSIDSVDELKAIYSKVYLMRNERQMHIYSCDGGERFEPDYVLFSQKNNIDGFEQLQVFVEPKCTHLVENDKWKEDFVLQLKDNAIPVKTFVNDNKYHI